AVDVLHGEIDSLVDRPHVVDRDHVGMLQPRREPGLALDARAGRGDLIADELERDLAVELRIERRVYSPHRTGADEIEQDVAAEHRILTELCVAAGRARGMTR